MIGECFGAIWSFLVHFYAICRTREIIEVCPVSDVTLFSGFFEKVRISEKRTESEFSIEYRVLVRVPCECPFGISRIHREIFSTTEILTIRPSHDRSICPSHDRVVRHPDAIIFGSSTKPTKPYARIYDSRKSLPRSTIHVQVCTAAYGNFYDSRTSPTTAYGKNCFGTISTQFYVDFHSL